MAKRILLSYKSEPIHFFGDSYEFNYTLEIEKSYWFFGRRKKIEKIRYVVSMFESIKTYHDHWDKMIKNKTPIEK